MISINKLTDKRSVMEITLLCLMNETKGYVRHAQGIL